MSEKILIFDRLNNKISGNGFNYFNKLDEIQATKDDLIIIANPASYHYETLIQLLDCEAPMLLEKPLSKEILTTSKIKKLNDMFGFVHVGYNLRYHPAVKLVKGQIAKQTYVARYLVFCHSGGQEKITQRQCLHRQSSGEGCYLSFRTKLI